ncbi:unnamed protein product [Spodoptera exigua]|nr:unnamed protein product [Spodoptera exigua]
MNVSPFVKQMFVAAAPQLAAVSMGGSLGYPCVLIQQFQSNETSIKTDLSTLTWIETKNRTLQEIEDYYNYGSFDRFRHSDDVEVKTPIVKNGVVD